MPCTMPEKTVPMVSTAIYKPKGAALEYSPLSANLYRGCSHGCRYCYAPSALRVARDEFERAPKPRTRVLERLRKDAAKFAAHGECGPVLLCFTSDPYQPCEERHELTRGAIGILSEAGIGIRVLTKNPRLAITRDLALMRSGGVEFGVSLSWASEADRRTWEPNAGTVAERVDALAKACEAGLRTWVSIEPVIDPAQALDVLNLDTVDVFKVGKLNHDKAREAGIDWRKFLADVLAKLEGRECGYYIKNDLWAWADKEIKHRWPRRSPRSA